MISKFNKGVTFLLCFIRDKNEISITNAFQKICDESNCKFNKID